MSGIAFKHQALDDSAQNIRLIYVKAQQTAPFLELCLSTHSVTDTLQYLAVSYTWGDGRLTEDISINGHLMKITKNCLYALEQIKNRYPSDEDSEEPIKFWIDSICINQDDNDEKGHQVAMMGNIYAKATKVLACIGPAADNSTILRTVLDDIQIHHTQFYAYREHLRSGGWGLPDTDRKIAQFLRSYLRGSITPKDKFVIQFRKACLDFAHRSYWTRLWIIQEFTAPDRSGNGLEVLCGGDSFSKSEINLCLYIASFLHKKGNVDDADEHGLVGDDLLFVQPHCLTTIMRFDALKSVPLGTILFLVGDLFHCMKPEDRVYGLLPLVEWPDGMPRIQPVYKPSSALELAELMISITDEDPHFCRVVLQALEVYHDYEPLKTLVEVRIRMQCAHRISSCSKKYPIRASYKRQTSVLPLYRSSAGKLSASLHCSTGSIKDPVSEQAAFRHADENLDKAQVLFSGSRIAGLLCGEAQEGDVIMKPRPSLILVFRRSNHNGLHRMVGQGLLCEGFEFPTQGSKESPLSIGLLKRELKRIEDEGDLENESESLKAEIEKAHQPGQKDLTCVVELRAQPIEWLIFEGQDLCGDSQREIHSMFKRLHTKLYMEATIV
jgi:hypothetical protein